MNATMRETQMTGSGEALKAGPMLAGNQSGQAASLASYSLTARIFHWFTAGLFLIQFPVGFTMTQMEFNSTTAFLYSTHKSLGFFILWLAVLRLGYRLRNNVERSHSQLAGWHYTASVTAHYTIYALLILVPLSGWLGASAYGALEVFGLVKLPALMARDEASALWILWAHGLFAFTLLAVIVLHIGIAMQGYLDGPDEAQAPRTLEAQDASARSGEIAAGR